MENKKTIKLEESKNYFQKFKEENEDGQIIEIDGYEKDTKVQVKIRMLNLMEVIEKENLPNPLLNAAANLFSGNSGNSNTDIKGLCGLTNFFVKKALIEPKYEDVILTTQQSTAIFSALMSSFDKLKPSFDTKTHNDDIKHSTEVSEKTE